MVVPLEGDARAVRRYVWSSASAVEIPLLPTDILMPSPVRYSRIGHRTLRGSTRKAQERLE